jgi:hypothetical protein
VTAALLILLGMSASLRATELQVEARTAAGAELPEIADAVARALVAGGARVVMGGPANEPCERCAQILVTELDAGNFRVEVTQERHSASTRLRLSAGSSLFDRARAISIQARLLITWEAAPTAKAKEGHGRKPPNVAAAPVVPPAPAPVQPAPDSTSTFDRSEFLPDPPAPRPPVAIVPPPLRTADATASSVPAAPRPTPPPPRETASAVPAAPRPAPPPPREAVEKKGLALVKPAGKEPLRESAKSSRADVEIREENPVGNRWPWIPTLIGAGAAVGAGICAYTARKRYDSLSDKKLAYDRAVGIRDEGKNWQTASFVFAGVAAAGLTAGLIGFLSELKGDARVVLSPIVGGGMIALAGGLP